ncbi:MAG: AEC family transporter [Alphaproteobacteria bacterium]|nr:AEC family transporter [Alphaproteobacteria bacterium]
MLAIGLSLLPVFLLIVLGVLLRRASFPGDALWAPLERLVYFVLFPPLLFQTIVTAKLDHDEALRLSGAFLLGITAMAAILLAIRRALPVSGAAFSSIFQGAIRWNSYVALGVVAALLGPRGVALAAVAFATMVPAVNLLSVWVITRYAGDTPAAGAAVIRALIANPLIIACLAALLVVGLGIPVPDFLLRTLKTMGDSTIALGLLAVGAALDFAHLRASGLTMGVTIGLKLLVMPLLMAAACMVLGVTGDARLVAIVCGSVPSASSAYILARQLGGDAKLMATLITALTLVSVATVPLAIALLG